MNLVAATRLAIGVPGIVVALCCFCKVCLRHYQWTGAEDFLSQVVTLCRMIKVRLVIHSALEIGRILEGHGLMKDRY